MESIGLYIHIPFCRQKCLYCDFPSWAGREGQMQMYVHYYERELINEGDNPLIGIVLCADKSESVVKYMLPENETQIFASKYKLYLPSEEELLRELNQEYQALEADKAGEENIGDIKK